MGLEAATYINQLNPLWPLGASDPVGQGDDHLRMLKATIQATFPNITGPVTLTQGQINAITGFAAPSVKVKATGAFGAGAATTAVRSDAQHLLDLTDTYAWTGSHTWTQTPAIQNSAPTFNFQETDQAADEKLWRFNVNGKTFLLQTVDDAISTTRNILSALRGTGIAVSSISIGNATDNPPTNFLGTGLVTLGGALTVPGQVTLNKTGHNTGTALRLISNDPGISFRDSDNGADAKEWEIISNSTNWQYGLTDDAGSNFKVGLRFGRAAGVINIIDIGNATDNPPINMLGTGAVTTGGPIRTPNGTTGAPSNSFSAETTLGWFRNGAGDMRASVNADVFQILAAASGGAKVADLSGTLTTVGYRQVPRSTTVTTLAANDVGKCVAVTAAINIPISVFVAGDCLSIYNDSAASVNLTISAGTLRLGGTTSTGTRAIAARGMCTVWFNVGGATPEAIASGPGVS